MTGPEVRPAIDRDVLKSYLNDHLTGAAGGRARANRMKQWYAETPIGSGLAAVADEIDEEYHHLHQLVGRLGLRRRLPLLLLARAGEMAGRLKPNGRGAKSSPVTPVLELELLRAAVNGKQGLWQTLAEHSGELGLDEQEYRRRSRLAEQQERVLEDLHARCRARAFGAIS